MQEIIEIPTIKELDKVIYNPRIKRKSDSLNDIKLMRIVTEENYTRIDFVYCNGRFQWVQIDPASFIRLVGTDVKYPLIKAQGIPLTPKKHIFKDRNETLYYSLFFAALPKSTKTIDIIEKECNTQGHHYFNFYGVSMEAVKTQRIEVGN